MKQDIHMKPLDHLVAAALTLASFCLLFVRYWFPPGKMFDEIYFARAAEEYLQRRYIYEYTHPPVSKLLITLSTMLFGGLPRGDSSFGWRFLDVVAGALMVWLLFVLAKRITGSTLFAGYASALLALDGMHFVQSRIATPESFVGLFSLAATYTFLRYWTSPFSRSTPSVRGRQLALASGALCGIGLTLSLFANETSLSKVIVVAYVIAGAYFIYLAIGERRFTSPSDWWLLMFAASAGLLVASKWYGIMTLGAACIVVVVSRLVIKHRDRQDMLRTDIFFVVLIVVAGGLYVASYLPQFIGLSDVPGALPRHYTLSDIVQLQSGMYSYHATLHASHPYSSVWWQWPLDLRPILYYAQYGHGQGGQITTAAMIYSLPNPLILWAGLICVPLVCVLAIRERDKGLILVSLSYLLQWLPWSRSPRLSFAYHFYVDIAPTCLCVAVIMQRLWNARKSSTSEEILRTAVVSYFLIVGIAFMYFYPELAGVTLPYEQWFSRLWLRSWL